MRETPRLVVRDEAELRSRQVLGVPGTEPDRRLELRDRRGIAALKPCAGPASVEPNHDVLLLEVRLLDLEEERAAARREGASIMA